MKTIYIMRHGETDWNREGRLQGQRDCVLNERGRTQAREAGERFRQRGLRFDTVYSSTLARARETACLCAGVTESDLRLEPRLMEMDFGPYDGMRLREAGEEMWQFFRDPVGHPLPGMEPATALLERTGAFLEDLRADDTDGTVLVVTHGVAIRALLSHLTGKGNEVWSMPIDNCVLYETRLEHGVFTQAVLSERSNDDGTQETY